MANQWYVQHGGKLYGPLTSSNLKKLADEGKIAPTTTVRLGTEGNWIAASRVQGLFAAAAPGSSATAAAPRAATAPPPRAAAPQPAKVVAPPIAPPPAPPKADPLARVSVAPAARSPKAVPAASAPVAPKILGAVALIFGILALATFWLPLLGGLMGWTGIIVGALGLLLGIAGLVLAAMHKGSGLALGVAGSSTSVVGLALTIVLGATFGLFTSAPPPNVFDAASQVVQTIVEAPKEPPKEEPPPAEPEPEIVWTPADMPIEQGPIRARIAGAKIEMVRLENADLSNLRRQKAEPMLKIRVSLENITEDKIVQFPGWMGGGDLLGQGLGPILSAEAAKAVQSATATAALVDNFGNAYKQTPGLMIFGAAATLGKDISIRPAKVAEAELVFPPPLDTIEFLRLELSPLGFGGSEPLRFQIPKAMVAKAGA